jgi:hypothetical protein
METPRSSLFRAMPWSWVLVWLCLPFLPVMLMWPLGGPPMGRYWLGLGLAGLVAAQLPWLVVRRALLLALCLAVVAIYMGATFNISLLNSELLMPFLREVRPLRSPEYVVGAVVVLGAMIAAWVLAPRVPRGWNVGQYGFGLLAVLALVNADNLVTASTAGSYQGLPDPKAPFSSAVQQAGLTQPSAQKRHLVIILVEAMGQPASQPELGLFEKDWNRPEWRARYDVSRGTSPYYGSTTSGELRELCGVWADYLKFDYERADCLPKRYAAAGYQTSGWHSFTSEYFTRTEWWPRTGLKEMLFADELGKLGVKPCGGVFPGACDTDVTRLIGQRLKSAQQPQMVYWVTLNMHLPLLADESLGTQDCKFGGAALADRPPMLCRLFLVQHQLADAVTKMALDPALPPTDILIVGDHMPPFFQRDARVRYVGDKVPWILLKAR